MSVWRILFLNSHPLYANGLAAGLSQIGHEVHIFNPALVPRQQHGQAVGQLIDSLRPDIVISVGYVNHFMDAAAVLSAIRCRPVFHVYWATEDRPFHDQISVPCARFAHAVFTLDSGCIPRYQSLGLPAEVLPFACNPAMHHTYPPNASFAHDIVLLCNNTPAGGTFRQTSLINLLQPFLGGGYDLAVWGHNWESPFADGVILPPRYYHGVLSYESSVKAASSAKIVLGPQWDIFSPTQVSCRTFETLGAGGFMLTSDVSGVHHFFQHNVHLVTTDCPARTKELIDRYLADAAGRRVIAVQGQCLVHNQHTYLQRARQFTEAITRWR